MSLYLPLPDPFSTFEISDELDHTALDQISMTDLYKLYWLSNHGIRVDVRIEATEINNVEQWLKDRHIPFYQSRYSVPLTIEEFHSELRIRAQTNNDKGMTEDERLYIRQINSAFDPITLRFVYEWDCKPTYYFFFWEPKEALMFKLTWGGET